ncbi:energy transducer TonB [uncultured Mesonia sp.]|uniref:energy transducer TonB n=1 Tax=uncultured Mesonia sp. TaxID=399731 RepID=UPI00374EC12B
MKRFILLLFILSSPFAFSQVNGNTVSSKEIAPIWPGCEEVKAKADCFNKMLSKHIQQNFTFPEEYTSADKGSKVIVRFIIDKQGQPAIKKVSGGAPYLQEAAKKIILSIPKMQPGSLNGEPRAISYAVPFNF